ncbi:hypothetical protein PQR33_36160 [Paraburkholderia sediminicola]|uniref:hypothetical protein n=1 Tax=Paraburkholderia sediminicola TaxID=458836 RepID=UPI0038B76CD7
MLKQTVWRRNGGRHTIQCNDIQGLLRALFDAPDVPDVVKDAKQSPYFLAQGIGEFLSSRFSGDEETLDFTHGMLTGTAIAELQVELRRLRQRVGALHADSVAAPLRGKRGVGVLLALREWEPESFTARRRA